MSLRISRTDRRLKIDGPSAARRTRDHDGEESELASAWKMQQGSPSLPREGGGGGEAAEMELLSSPTRDYLLN